MKEDDIGDRFHELTKYSPLRLGSGGRPARRPAAFKDYPRAEAVTLVRKAPLAGSLWTALGCRRSRRNFTPEPMRQDDLAMLLWAAQGHTGRAGELILRPAPSAGALYPIETYLVVNRVSGIKEGVYHYNIRKTALELIKAGAWGRELAAAALEQGMCVRAAAVFVLTAIADRCKWKYAQRGWRYIYMEAGHIGQNLYLAAEDLGLGCCAIGAFYDQAVNDLLGLDGANETTLYLLALGPVKEGEREE
jgi:SagB-type dehydrogenase family enzyme